jgi:hypothetical protein
VRNTAAEQMALLDAFPRITSSGTLLIHFDAPIPEYEGGPGLQLGKVVGRGTSGTRYESGITHLRDGRTSFSDGVIINPEGTVDPRPLPPRPSGGTRRPSGRSRPPGSSACAGCKSLHVMCTGYPECRQCLTEGIACLPPESGSRSTLGSVRRQGQPRDASFRWDQERDRLPVQVTFQTPASSVIPAKISPVPYTIPVRTTLPAKQGLNERCRHRVRFNHWEVRSEADDNRPANETMYIYNILRGESATHAFLWPDQAAARTPVPLACCLPPVIIVHISDRFRESQAL